MPHYFAYGSNLSSTRLRQPDRAPSARLAGIAAVSGWTLAWHKRGADGSGKCTLCPSERRADGVWGVLWELEPGDIARLDEVEGPGYERIALEVTTGNQRVTAFTYVALASHVDPLLAPSERYRELVLAGAREHGLPASWIALLERGGRSIPAEPVSRRA